MGYTTRRSFTLGTPRGLLGSLGAEPTREMSMAGTNNRRHNDNRVMCLRIFADASGETHMEDFEIAFQPRKLFKDNPPLRLSALGKRRALKAEAGQSQRLLW